MGDNRQNFFRKYFWEGQHLSKSANPKLPENASCLTKFFIKYRKYIAFFIPFIIMQAIWWSSAFYYNWFPLFKTRWEMPLVMILGATVAGMTSEGGGAVAFPIMTLALKMDPSLARDFSLIIQSIGMMSAAFVVLFMKIKIEKQAAIYGTMGSIPGFILGSLFIDPYLDASQKKMLFVSIWSSFAIALYILNQQEERQTLLAIPNVKSFEIFVLFATGCVGGIFTSFAGSGVDICIFSMLTLLFRISEKVATPTTIVMMGLNSLLGVIFRVHVMRDVNHLAWDYVKVCVPVVATLAPFGSFLGSHFHRHVLAFLIYILETLAVIGFLISRPPAGLILCGIAVMIVGFFFFRTISRRGKIRLRKHMACDQETEKKECVPFEVECK